MVPNGFMVMNKSELLCSIVLYYILNRAGLLHQFCFLSLLFLMILIGQRDVHHQVGLVGVDEVDDLLHVVRVHPGSGDLRGGLALQRLGQRVALLLRAAGDAQLREDLADLAALPDGHAGDAAAADNQYSAHFFT